MLKPTPREINAKNDLGVVSAILALDGPLDSRHVTLGRMVGRAAP